jgi:hypothetical protein
MNVIAQQIRDAFATFSKGTYDSNARNEERIIECPIDDIDFTILVVLLMIHDFELDAVVLL